MKYRNILREVLDSRCMTQEELSKKTGINCSTISLYVSNKRRGNILTWLKISKALNMTINDFFVKDDIFRYKEVE